MEIYIYKAECGDAFRITFLGNDQKHHHIFIDAGYERTFRNLISDDLNYIHDKNEVIDIWIISHIHDDHIGGAINYVNAIQKSLHRDIVKQWWYNPPRLPATGSNNNNTSVATSIGQGDDLTHYLSLSAKLPVVEFNNTLKPENIEGMNLIILSPGKAGLTDLYNKYELPEIKLERNEDAATDDATYVKPRDYQITVDEFDLEDWREDDNIDNGSSIAVLMEIDDHRSLWLADAFPSVIAMKLRDMGYNKKNRLNCDLVKVAHHGCDNNNSDDLYALIQCQHYLISADGRNKHALPNKKSLVRILKNSQRDLRLIYHFYFTYDDPVLRSIFKIDGPDIFDKLNFRMHFGTTGFNL